MCYTTTRRGRSDALLKNQKWHENIRSWDWNTQNIED